MFRWHGASLVNGGRMHVRNDLGSSRSQPRGGRQQGAGRRPARGGPEARIVALYVASEVPTFIANQIPDGVREEHIATARVELSSRADEVGAECEIRAGHAATAILECANEIGADLVVIASHRPGVQDYLLGSTAARVVRHADCTVLVER